MKNRPTRSAFQARLQHFVETIKKDRLSGVLAAGSYLPAETELARIYHLSKLSVRKGLEQLAAEGIIEKIPRVGNRIRAIDSSAKQVVRFACHSSLLQEAAVDALIERFEAEHPNIRIQVIPFPFQQYVETIDHYVDNDLIDILTINNDQFVEFKTHDRLKLFETEPFDARFYDKTQEGFTSQDRMYAKPFVFSPVMLCYNRNHLRALNVPEPNQAWSWEDLKKAAKQLSDKQERYGFYFHLLSQNRWPIFLLQNGFHSNGDKHAQNGDRFIESMELCKELILEQGVTALPIADDDLQAEHLFLKEKASIIMTTYFNMTYLLDSGIDFDISPIPNMHEPKTLLISVGLSIMSGSSRKEAARCFAEFLTGYEAQLFIRSHRLAIPCLKQAAEWSGTPQCRQPARYGDFLESMNSLAYYEELGMTPQQLMKLRQEVSLYWSGLYDERRLLEELKRILK